MLMRTPTNFKKVRHLATALLVIGVLFVSYSSLLRPESSGGIYSRGSGNGNVSGYNAADISLSTSTDFNPHYNGSKLSDHDLRAITKSVLNVNKGPGIISRIISLLWSWSIINKPTTKPFLETSAAATSEINLLLNNFNGLSKSDRLQIIDDILDDIPKDKYEFMKHMFENLYENRPKTRKLDRYKKHHKVTITRYEYGLMDNLEKDPLQFKDPNFAIFNEPYLSDFLQLTDNELSTISTSHDLVVKNLPDGNIANKLYKGGNGIVYVGGGNFNFLTLLSIKAIRDLGSKTPVEILIPSLDEFDANLCFKVFPKYDAKCLLLPKLLKTYNTKEKGATSKRLSVSATVNAKAHGKTHFKPTNNKNSGSSGSSGSSKDSSTQSVFDKVDIKGYQYKILALLLTSFENVLFLDSDNIPTRNPDQLFDSNPFKKHGLIIWPDYWKRSTSPLYYQIANITIDRDHYLPKYNEMNNDYEPVDYTGWDKKNIPFHQFRGALPDPSSESGQLLINKKTHLRELVLALYYNLYGPSHYYPLFSQGSAGEGDKETFIAACAALGGDFYQVKHFLKAIGHFQNGEFFGTAMGQYNPINDYERLPAEIFFVHANFPKLNPWDLKKDGKVKDPKTGKRHRLFGDSIKENMDYDFELMQWKNMKYFICQLNLDLVNFRSVEHDALCTEINDQLRYLESTSHLIMQ